MILICRKGLAGMHLQGKSDPDLLKYQLRDACGAAKCIHKSRKSKSEMHDRPKQSLQAREGLSVGLSIGLSVCRITKKYLLLFRPHSYIITLASVERQTQDIEIGV